MNLPFAKLLKPSVGALSLGLAISLGSFGLTSAANARDQISIVGSSTVFPFSTVVAENFGRSTSFKSPVVESLGTGGGFKLFCSGVGVTTPDIANASRRIKTSEFEDCQKNGVNDIVEVKIGYDGIVFANAKDALALNLTKKQIFMALAKLIPNEKGELVANPYNTWSDIDSTLPNVKIEIIGPPPTSGTRDAFLELVMEEGAAEFPEIKALKGDAFKAAAHGIREDGMFVEGGENDNLIVQKLLTNNNAFGIFGFSFLDQNSDTLKGAPIGGVVPVFETIMDGSYKVSRPMYFYLKKDHVAVIPGLKEFLAEFVSEKAIGQEGYLGEKGLISMSDEERNKFATDVANLNPLKM